MTICFLSVCQFNEFTGGVDRVCCLLSREFIRRGYKIVYVFKVPSKLGHPALGCEGEGQYQFPFDIWDNRNIPFFLEVVERHNIDVVIDVAFVSRYHYIAFSAKQNNSFKLITTNHSDPMSDLKELIDKIECLRFNYSGVKLYLRQFFSIAKYPLSYLIRYQSLKNRLSKIIDESDCYVVLSEGYADKVKRIIASKIKNRVVAISNPIVSVNTLVGSHKKNQVLFVGRLSEQKRLDRLLRIWQNVQDILTDWKLIIIGDGEARDKYEVYAKKLHLRNICFCGSMSSSEEMENSKIITMVSSHEGFGMTLVEGMSVGTVPIAFDNYEALRDIVDDGVNGFCVIPFSQSEFASRIIELASNGTLLSSMSAAAMEKVKQFDISIIADRWEALFQK